MNVTSIDLTVWEDRGQATKIKAFCSVVFDNEFVVHDIKIIDGNRGLYVVMPSRRLTDACPTCSAKTPYNDRFCGACGAKLGDIQERQPERDVKGKRRLYVDVAHPLNSEARKRIEEVVLEEYRERTFGVGIFCSGTIPCSSGESGDWMRIPRIICSGAA